jgi:hypothetical protein
MEYVISEQVRAWGKCHGYDVELHLDLWNDYLANRKGKPYRDPDAAYRNCIRSDYGGLRRAQARWMPPQYIPPDKVVRANTFVPLPKDTAVPAPDNAAWRRK